MFPNLFRLTTQKNVRAVDLWDCDSGDGGWNPIFLRSFNDLEMKEVNRLLQVLHRKQIRPLMEDKILFKGSINEAFYMKIMYMMLDCSPQVVFPSRTIWNPVIPPIMGFFAWEASWRKILTLDQLKRRGRAFSNRCFLCEEDDEDINHMLLHCKNARMLWDFSCRLLEQVGFFRIRSFKRSYLGKVLQWVKNIKTFGLQPRYVYSGLCGRIGTWWFLKIGLLRIIGQILFF